jgi:antitoxin FitA
MPVNILIRDVPDEVRETLAAVARARGQSMQAYLQEVLASQARLSRNMALIDAARATVATDELARNLTAQGVVELIRRQRQEREDELVRRVVERDQLE